MVTATPNTIRWKRRTNAIDRSGSPAPRPASSVSSGSVSAGIAILCTLFHTEASSGGLPRRAPSCQPASHDEGGGRREGGRTRELHDQGRLGVGNRQALLKAEQADPGAEQTPD